MYGVRCSPRVLSLRFKEPGYDSLRLVDAPFDPCHSVSPVASSVCHRSDLLPECSSPGVQVVPRWVAWCVVEEECVARVCKIVVVLLFVKGEGKSRECRTLLSCQARGFLSDETRFSLAWEEEHLQAKCGSVCGSGWGVPERKTRADTAF